ncbi:MAG: ATP-binding protein [Victivallales bacterium]
MISADKIKIQRIVANLLDNAIKFTPAGGFITLDLSARDGMAEIRICDTGCGIPEKDLENIFKRFYRADSSRTLPGNGGLSLVHAIVEAHHGKIHVASSEKGSIFTVCLPLC